MPRRMRHTTIQLIRCCLVLAFVLLTGCAGQAAPIATPAPVSAPQTIVLWHGWSGSERQALSSIVETYNRSHSSGRVLAQSIPLANMVDELRAQVLAGGGPHLALVPNTWVGDLAQANVITPLDTLLTADDQRPLLPAALAGARAAGADGVARLYGAPISYDTLALFYNRANMSAAPADTDQLLQLGRGLSDTGATPPIYGLAINLSLENTLGYLYAFGGRIFDAQGQPVLGSTGRDGAERWLAWLARLNADQDLLARQGTGVQVDRELKNGHVLMSVGWSHQLAEYRRLWGDQLGVAPLPPLSATRATPEPYVQGQVLVISRLASPAEQQAAAAFIRAALELPAQRALLSADLQPVRTDLALTDQTPQARAALALRTGAVRGQPMPNDPRRAVVRRELQRMIQRVLTGQAEPAQAVTDADAALRALK